MQEVVVSLAAAKEAGVDVEGFFFSNFISR